MIKKYLSVLILTVTLFLFCCNEEKIQMTSTQDHMIVGPWAAQRVFGAIGNIIPGILFNKDGTGKFLKKDFSWELISKDTLSITLKRNIDEKAIPIIYHISGEFEKEKSINLELTNVKTSYVDFVLCRPNGNCGS